VSEPKVFRAGDPEPDLCSGAVVAINYGYYRDQEIWVSSGANIGVWYPLGGEFWMVWDRGRMPAGVTKVHNTWDDLLARGPVTLLVAAEEEPYKAGWRAGRRDLLGRIAEMSEDDPGEAC
jgi:hypothetical protein